MSSTRTEISITNRESVAYRSFRPSEFEARGVRKVTTGITGLWQPSVHSDVCSLLGFFIVPSGCGVPTLIVSSAPRSNLSLVWVLDRWVWMLLLVRNGHVSGEMVVCVGRLRASCIELSSRSPLQCPPLVAVVPKGCDRDPVLRT
ncbi:hypothetical protein V6N13_037238 [Hibiscus sabdariffa]